MAVKKRVWTTKAGVEKSTWVVDYYDSSKIRRLKTFKLKKDADAFAAGSKIELGDGTHIADRASVTVEQAGKLWIASRVAAGRERTTVDQYTQHVELHIAPFIGAVKLNALSVPLVRKFEDDLRKDGRSAALIRKVTVSLGSLVADAQERGLVARNVVRDMRSRRAASDHRAEKRAKGKLKVGVDIPTPEEIKAVVGALQGRWRPAILTAIFTGLRGSELRGLTWDALDLKGGFIHISRRADRYNTMGRPKSETSERSVPIPPHVASGLKAWRHDCPKSEANLVFPNLAGGVLSHQELMRDGWGAAQVRAGVSSPGKDEKGRDIVVPKYSGLHATRHFYASWCINRKRDNGLELPAKMVQERLGHASITLTLNTYSHLFPNSDNGDELAEASGFFF